MKTLDGKSAAWQQKFDESRHLFVPKRPDWIVYSDDPRHIKDDPTGETHATFMDRFRIRYSEDELGLLEDAYVFSKYGHRGIFRASSERYFNHLRSTALICPDELEIYDLKTICSELMHDSREERRFLRGKLIKKVFGRKIMVVVNLLTKDERSKEMYITRIIASQNWRALLTKCCDRLHNMRTLHYMKHAKIPEQILETRVDFPAVFAALTACIPKKYAHAVPYLENAIWGVCDAQEALWEIDERDLAVN
jgi:hypothetical protein